MSDLLNLQGKGEIARLVDAVLFQALGRGASDVHLQPLPTGTLVRIRVDGVLHDVREIPTEVAVAVTSRVKVMGRMDIAERRVPQDGRATVTIGDRPADLRISTVPTSHGERVVVRLLDRERQPCSFRARPQQDLTSRLHETLGASGAGTGLLSEVAAHGGTTAPGSGDAGGGGKYALQQMRVTLKGARLADLGKFLERWRSTQPLWTVTSVDLTRAMQTAAAGSQKAAPDERFNATVVLTSSYVSAARNGSPRP